MRNSIVYVGHWFLKGFIMNKHILATLLVSGLIIPAAAQAQSTITTTSTGPTTIITRSTDTDPRAAKIVSPEEFSTYVYSRWDKNGDGFISKDEWDYNVSQWYGPKVTTYRNYTDWDLNHNGQIDPSEFDAALKSTGLYKTWSVTTTSTSTDTTRLSPDAAFAAHDLNGDGKIVPSEWNQTYRP